MAHWLAQLENFDDWVQIIVVVLIVVGGALGPVLKKLIEFFGASKADRPGEFVEIELEPEAPPMAAPPRPASSRPRIHGDPPSRVPPPAPVSERVEHRVEPPDAVSRHPPVAVPLPKKPIEGAPGRRAGSKPVGREASRRTESGKDRRISRDAADAKRTSRMSPRGESQSDLSRVRRELTEAVSKAAGPGGTEDSAAKGKASHAGAALFSEADPTSLQRAVILSEVLAPPLGLRPFDQRI